ncbi:MAG TPA: hypothetical protein P5277_02745 [Candidatus Paceibacterota bacterium]|nr:hypothetical protein [Candidatus Paceibacterota bacterium]
MKRGWSLLFVLLITFSLISFVFSEDETDYDANLKKARDCLRNKVGTDCSQITMDEQAAVLLSVGSIGEDKNCKSEYLSFSQEGICWPQTNCKIKETAIATLVLESLGQNTDKPKEWLLNQTKTATDLIWYLQIESDSAAECSISYRNVKSIVSIGEDKKIKSLTSSCFTVSDSGYWLKINNNCLSYDFTISCETTLENDFITTLLYKSQNSPTIHVSQSVHSGSSGGETIEQIIYKCFKQGNSCNYEGSLWATMVLTHLGEDTTSFVPYIDAFAEENKNLFPEAFLYASSGAEDYLVSILTDNFKKTHWNVGSYGKYYSTALAFLALQGSDYPEIAQAKEYLLNGKIQNTEGCWGSIRDTGFLLYTGWGSQNFIHSDTNKEECESNSDCGEDEECLDGICVIVKKESCVESGKYCVSSSTDCIDSKGTVDSSLSSSCPITQVCCSEQVIKSTCISEGGVFCKSNEECLGNRITDISDSSKGICCNIECEIVSTEEKSECETEENTCKTECADNEEEVEYSCDEGLKCCEITEVEACPTGQQRCEDGPYTGMCKENCEKSKSLWWIWVLVILIILVALGIVFRKKISEFISKSKMGIKKGPPPKPTRPVAGMRPGMARPMSGMRPGMARPRPVFPQRSMPGPNPQLPKDKEYDETLKKLREMSK